jgi:hypothetical protein
MKIQDQKIAIHYVRKMEGYPILCVISALATFIFKLIYRHRPFSTTSYIQAYAQDKSILSCVKNILGKPSKVEIGIRETVLNTLEARKKNLRQEFAFLKQALRFDYFPFKKNDMNSDPVLLLNFIDILPCLTGQMQNFSCFTREFAEKALRINGRILWYLDLRFKNDDYLVEVAVRQNGASLLDAHPRFLQSKHFVLLALNTHPEMYVHINHTLKLDQDIALKLIDKRQDLSAHIPQTLKQDAVFTQTVERRFGRLW